MKKPSEYIQAKTVLGKFRDKYPNLDASDIHGILQGLNIEYVTKYFGDYPVKLYNKPMVLYYYNNGEIQRRVMDIINKRNMPNPDIVKSNPIVKPNSDYMKRKGQSILINRPEPQIEDDYMDYRNSENDMEKYSEYLINNVYENKMNKNMAKVKITENKLKQIIMESVKRALKESYDDEEIDYEGNGYERPEWNYDDNDWSEDELLENPESYYWHVYILDKEKKSTKYFNSVKEAVNDCNNFLKKINFKAIAAKYNFDEDKVCALIEYGNDEWNDTMLQNYGWGWMD